MPQYHWQSICYDPWRTDTTQALFIILSKTIAPNQRGDKKTVLCSQTVRENTRHKHPNQGGVLHLIQRNRHIRFQSLQVLQAVLLPCSKFWVPPTLPWGTQGLHKPHPPLNNSSWGKQAPGLF